MTKEQLIAAMKFDLTNEVKHMHFYLRAATEVEGLHREELREYFLKEAHEELNHVNEFSTMISYLGGEVDHNASLTWTFGHNPYDILAEVVRMEQEVANNYALRLLQTEGQAGADAAAIATAHVFYEDQINHSQTTAWEVQKWMTKFCTARITNPA